MVSIIKSTGEREPFDEQKVRNSIKRIGIADSQKEEVVEHVKSKLYEGIPTSEIYHHISEFLDRTHPYARAKYSLKKAVMQLGPTGYPFEDFVASLLAYQGYTTTVRQIVKGKCITHEIDVIAKKAQENIMVEAKFHNAQGIKTNVHVAMYTWARFEDVKTLNGFNKAMLVTNTKITTDAVSYAQCNGLDVLSWSYPVESGLKDLIERFNLTPITALGSLSNSQKQALIQNGVGLCQTVCKKPDSLNILSLPKGKIEQVTKEAEFLCA